MKTNGDLVHISQLGLVILNKLKKFIKIFNRGLVDVQWQSMAQSETSTLHYIKEIYNVKVTFTSAPHKIIIKTQIVIRQFFFNLYL